MNSTCKTGLAPLPPLQRPLPHLRPWPWPRPPSPGGSGGSGKEAGALGAGGERRSQGQGRAGTGEGEGGAAAADGGRQNTSLINACTVEHYPHMNTVQDIRPLLTHRCFLRRSG